MEYNQVIVLLIVQTEHRLLVTVTVRNTVQSQIRRPASILTLSTKKIASLFFTCSDGLQAPDYPIETNTRAPNPSNKVKC